MTSAPAERRQLTVMFCDVVDSTSLARQLDPEDFREVVRLYQAACMEVIQHYDGYIAQYLGDGLLVYYGYPHAHEDDAQRAIRTGLGIAEAIKTLNPRLADERGVRLAVRLGIHTGLVVVGEMGGGDRREQLALGATPNVAAKIQGLAAPDTVIISAVTYRLTQGYFVCQDLGRHTILVACLLEEAERRPVLAVWEDLHWAAPSTLELLSLVIDQTHMARMLTLLTCRPEFQPPWGPRTHMTQITLSRLGRQQVEQMIVHLTQGNALPVEVLEQVLAKTDGVPLFVEELVKMILESGLVRETVDGYVLTGPLPPWPFPLRCRIP